MILAASVIALFIGPGLLSLLGKNRHVEEFLDGLVLVAIGGLVALHLLPESITYGGSWAVGAALLGFFIPMVAEHTVLGAGRGGDPKPLLLVLALSGLAIHAFLDGIALTEEAYGAIHAGHEHSMDQLGMLSLGVLLHRLPVGLALWSIVQPARGASTAFGLLAMLSLFTIAGHSLGPASVEMIPMTMFAVFQALIAGSLIHVVLHRPTFIRTIERAGLHTSGFLGAVCGLMLVGVNLVGHAHEHPEAGDGVGHTFYMLALESAPALLFAFLAGGLLKVLMPMNAVHWLRRGGATGQAVKGMAFGLPLPVCSCGVVPLYQSLTKRGAPPAAALAFLVATPELGVDALLVSLPLLGVEMTIARLICAAVVAVFVAMAVSRWMDSNAVPPEEAEVSKTYASRRERIIHGLRYGYEDLLDDTMPWIITGLAIAAIANPLLDAQWLRELPYGLEVPLFALLGMPVYVCASGATPIVAILLMHGVSPGAGIAFLLTGPATNMTTYGVLSGLHGRRTALLFGAAVAVGAMGVGFATDLYFDGALASPLSEGHPAHDSLLHQFSLAALCVAFAWSVLRIGPREQFAQVLPSSGGHDHSGHDHSGHDHSGHDHGHDPDEQTTSCCGGS